MTSMLNRLAKRHGISLVRPGIEQAEVTVSEATKRKLLAALNIEAGETAKSFLPDFLTQHGHEADEGGRVWGFSLQLYELRSSRNWGIGDFSDLRAVVSLAASQGADFIGLNPLHAPFLADPERCSPYEPSNRRYLNPLYIAVDEVAGYRQDMADATDIDAARSSDLVDYPAVARLKLTVLRRIWDETTSQATRENQDRIDFESFLLEEGESLRRHALFEAISSFMVGEGSGAGWTSWPSDYRDVDHPTVRAFSAEHAAEIEFQCWLQWIARQQLDSVSTHARQSGLRIGLYLDLAVGEALDGSATWSEPDIYVRGASIGSPPDPWAVKGQDWRLAALQPALIAFSRRSPYRRMIEAAMRYAGAVRIDHAAAIQRLFLVPDGETPEEGAYVDYPSHEILAAIAEASTQYRCLVIGEDLGLVPAGLRQQMAEAQLLSYRILSYERDKRGFIAPGKYPSLSLACVSTHDHHTMAGWWRGDDIESRADHGMVPKEATKQERAGRIKERADLLRALTQAGIFDKNRANIMPDIHEVVVAAHRYVARSSAMLVSVRLADLTDEERPTNVPGTSDGYPNWKPKLSVACEDLLNLDLFNRIIEAMCEERPKTKSALDAARAGINGT
ncbi:4-alpha-glucanotransferase [Allorhizobium taibaishanense]|nr:4-alpha-glucanotransferase [Allorhizobium taibaishanense]MBB4008591.1 4-alpha-glucanotransferase [Allorhizobium taibaishanense]